MCGTTAQGKFGLLGRRYRVDLKIRRTPGDLQGKPRALLFFGPKEAEVWSLAMRSEAVAAEAAARSVG